MAHPLDAINAAIRDQVESLTEADLQAHALKVELQKERARAQAAELRVKHIEQARSRRRAETCSPISAAPDVSRAAHAEIRAGELLRDISNRAHGHALPRKPRGAARASR
jgi:hypothetical protein